MARTKWNMKRSFDPSKKTETNTLKKDGEPKKKRRWKPGTVARREIQRFQRGKLATRMLVPTASLDKVIREVLQGLQSAATQISPRAREALRVSSEEYLTGIFKDAAGLASLRKAETIGVDDYRFAVKQSRAIEAMMRNVA